MAIKNYAFAKWHRNNCDYDWGGSASHAMEGTKCLDAAREAEWKATNEHPCNTYFVDPKTLRGE